MIDKIGLIMECFPNSWMRKMVLLLHKADCIRFSGGNLGAMLLTKGDRITLVCVSKKYRGYGLASKLIKRTHATKTYTYYGNEKAIKMWNKNGFKITGYQDSIFGERVLLEKLL